MKELIIFILGMLLGSIITIIEFDKQFKKRLKELELVGIMKDEILPTILGALALLGLAFIGFCILVTLVFASIKYMVWLGGILGI